MRRSRAKSNSNASRTGARGPFPAARTHLATSRPNSAMNASVPADFSMKFFELTSKLS